jgi:hypothetical protein
MPKPLRGQRLCLSDNETARAAGKTNYFSSRLNTKRGETPEGQSPWGKGQTRDHRQQKKFPELSCTGQLKFLESGNIWPFIVCFTGGMAMCEQSKRQCAFVVAMAVVGIVCVPVRADTIAASIQANGYQGSGYDQNIGWGFAPNANISVTSLGWFDAGGDGFAVSHSIGIFTSAGQLLVSGAVNQGVVNPIDGPAVTATFGGDTGVFRYAGISPTTLNAGQSYVIAGTNSPNPFDAFAVVKYGTYPWAVFSTNPAITFTNGWMSNFGTGGSLFFPTLVPGPGPDGAYFGPNFQFVSATSAAPVVPNPEPASLLVWGAVTLGMAGFAARRRR